MNAESWADLRTFNGHTYPTYKEACKALGLLEDDAEWRQCLAEAAPIQSGSALRQLFCTILFHCAPTTPEALWNEFKYSICNDLEHRLENIWQYRDRVFTDGDVYDYGLYLINDNLKNFGKTLQDFPNMPEPQQVWNVIPGNRLLQEETDYDVEELKRRGDENKAKFNAEQLEMFNAVMDSMENMIFIHSAGGCGKTFICNTLASAVWSNEDVALCVASSGIAALLLEGGRTAHSRFKIPIPALDTSIANIKRGTQLSQLLLQTKVVIWDEVPIQHKNVIASVDQGFRDILEKDVPFGGVTVVFGGDFQQNLSVIQWGLRQQMIAASLKRGRLWDQTQVHIGSKHEIGSDS
ncbi:hypothetical protein J132_11357 [Termitomyces sp. J132]|nr:hypothetical protein J132_11357 [Termitomyces sp. J132]